MTDLEERFIELLRAHQGRESAISVRATATALSISTRQAQDIKKRLVEDHGVLIGSSCGAVPGWYLPTNRDEVAATIRQYENRLKSLAVLIAKTRGASVQSVFGQLALEYGAVS